MGEGSAAGLLLLLCCCCLGVWLWVSACVLEAWAGFAVFMLLFEDCRWDGAWAIAAMDDWLVGKVGLGRTRLSV